MPTQTVVRQVRKLTREWKAAALAVQTAMPESTCKQDQAEEQAYDALVDFVEDNDLNWTEHDPRGTRAEFEATR